MRVLVTSADERALDRFTPDCETVVLPCDCLRRLREEPPDVLLLLAPVLWPATAAVFEALTAEPSLRHVFAVLLPSAKSHRAWEVLRDRVAGSLDAISAELAAVRETAAQF